MLQITSLQCSKELGPEKELTDGIACALKVLCSKKHEFQPQGGWATEGVEASNQCPAQETNIPRKLEQSLRDELVSFVLQLVC